MTLPDKRLVVRLSLALGVGTLLCFWSSTSHEFINVDDQQYIGANPRVIAGLTWQGMLWAFGSGYACNWHPVTWLSHMLDCQFYGLNPGGHHFTNVLLHAANVILVFLLLKGMTGATWRSALVAGFFAWHPLRVESVAWAAERKDVLSGFFGLLALMAYARYAQSPGGNRTGLETAATPTAERGVAGWRYYVLTLVLFSLALMSKPMLVTLPCVMLLLDFWPLRRTRGPLSSLVIEKVPFFLLSFAASVVTFLVQRSGGAVSSTSVIPFSARLANTLVSYVRYVGKTLWPTDLSPVYPYPDSWPIALVTGAAASLVIVTAWAMWRGTRAPAVVIGWLWFLGTLVPAIGLVQVGPQAMADRYTYWPSIGLLIALVWGVADAFPVARARALGLGSAGALAVCALLTQVQLRYWQDAPTLYQHAIAVTRDNYVAWDYLGMALHSRGRDEEALMALKESLRIKPRYAVAQYNLGAILLGQGKFDAAAEHLQIAVQLAPADADFRHSLGNSLFGLGRLPEAEASLREAAALMPGDANVLNDLGTVLVAGSKLEAARTVFEDMMRLEPASPRAHRNLGVALAQLGRPGEAVTHFAEAVRLDPKDADLRFNLGLALSDADRLPEAVDQFTQGLTLRPDDPRIHCRLAATFAKWRKPKEAVIHYREALRLASAFPDAQSGLAWILATSSDAADREGSEALRLAEQACSAGGPPVADRLTALAAAYAETGRFSDAAASVRKAHEVALAAGQSESLARATVVLHACEAGLPVRE